MSLFPLRRLRRVRPVAAADHFQRPGPLAWVARHLLRIIPFDRSGKGAGRALAPVRAALSRGDIVILYPEGSRGEPETLARFRRGIAALVEAFPEVPVVPVFLHGLGRALPKGERLFVPFCCDLVVGDPMCLGAVPRREIPCRLQERIVELGRDVASGWFETVPDARRLSSGG